jgi:ABC-type phosphate transport system substrate-binding protein
MLGALAAAWIFTFIVQRRRIAWCEHLDAPISLVPKEARRIDTWGDRNIYLDGEEVRDPSLVLLRIRNAGLINIGENDIRRPLTFTFPGRVVRDLAVREGRGVTEGMIRPLNDPLRAVDGNRIRLPALPMKRNDRFKLLVLLSGTNKGVRGRGFIRGGRVVRETRRRGPGARNLTFGGTAALLLVLLAGTFMETGVPSPSSCASGRLTLEGSTAFAPLATQISAAYHSTCHGAVITVNAVGTFNGLNDLNSAGQAGPAAASSQIAMSDGPVPPGYPGSLIGRPVGIVIFAMVVNKEAGVLNLTIPQVRGIYQGKITNWRQAGGRDQPIEIVSRDSKSGTRRAFEQRVLNRAEPVFSSYDCVNKNADQHSLVVRCEVPSTTALLQHVEGIPGAIGYAEISDVAAYPDIEYVKLNGQRPSTGSVLQRTYPFWAVEYLYTYRSPTSGTLTSAFLGYLTNTGTVKKILRSQGYIPCADLVTSRRNAASTDCSP